MNKCVVCTSMLTLTKWKWILSQGFQLFPKVKERQCFSWTRSKEDVLLLAGAASKGQRSLQTHPVSWKTIGIHPQLIISLVCSSLKLALHLLTTCMCPPFTNELVSGSLCPARNTNWKGFTIKYSIPRFLSWICVNIGYRMATYFFFSAQIWWSTF